MLSAYPRPSHHQAKSREITDNLNTEPDIEQGRAYYEGITNYTSSSAQILDMLTKRIKIIGAANLGVLMAGNPD